jgi:hypothetical protein
MGHALYNEGSGAIQDEEGATHMAVTDPIRVAIDMLGQGAHSFWQLAVVLTAVILLAICAGMAWARQSPFPALAIGGVVAAGLSLFAWIGAQVLGSSLDSNVDREIALVLRDGAWLGVRNGIAAAVIGGGLAFVVSAALPARRPNNWEHKEDWQDEWDDWDEEELEPVQSLPQRPPRF